MAGTYKLNDIYATIQGEGRQTGVPMILIRLQGCGVGCPWCDTKETWALDERFRVPSVGFALVESRSWCEADATLIASVARGLADGERWALVTGGEPADQDLAPLVAALHDAGFRVALETSGTATGHLGAGFDWVTVSPKVGMPGGKAVLRSALEAADELKMVLAKPTDLDLLQSLLDGLGESWAGDVCVQPVAGSDKALALCQSAARRHGWRVSLQSHKYAGIR